jgi:large repetitive protein
MAFPRTSRRMVACRRMVSCATATALVISGAAVAMTLYAPDASAASGTLLFTQPFNDNSLTGDLGSLGTVSLPGVQSGSNGACLTDAGNGTANPLKSCTTNSVSNDLGTLQLTSAATSQVGAVLLSPSVPTAQGLDVNFNSFQYGGSGADGISLVMAAVNPADPQMPATVGPSGGSLGYSGQAGNSLNGLDTATWASALTLTGTSAVRWMRDRAAPTPPT